MPIGLNHILKFNHWVIWIGSSLPIKLWQIVLGKKDISIFVIRCLNEKTGKFGILNHISDHVTLVQLIDTISNVNNAVSINGYWIYDYN